MTRSFAAALTALTFGLSLPAWAQDAYRPAQPPKQSAQSQPEQKRLPAAKEEKETSSSTGQAQGAAISEPTPDSAAKGQADQEQAKKHPPTAVMDQATPPEKSTSEAGATPKHPATSVMERATPEQKSPKEKSPKGSAEASK
jgi:hypothetical protein